MKKLNLKVMLLGALGLAVLVVLWIFINNYIQRSKASGDGVSITFNPRTGTAPVGEQKTSNMVITATGGKKISGLDITLTAQDNLKIVNVGTPVPVGGNDTSVFQQIIKTVADKDARLTYVSSKTEAELPAAVTVPVTFVGTGHIQGKLVVDRTKTQVVGTASGNVFELGNIETLEYSFGDQVGPTSPPGPTTVQGAPINLRFVPSSNTTGVGSTFITTLNIDGQPAGKKISGFSLVIKHNPAHLDIQAVDDPADSMGNTTKFVRLKKEIKKDLGEIHMTYISQSTEAELPTSAKVDIKALGKAAGNGTLQILNAQVTGNIPENVYTPNVQNGSYNIIHGDPYTTPNTYTTPYNTPTTGGNVTLNLKLKFQGVVRGVSNNSQQIAVRLAGGSLGATGATSKGTFTVDSSGVWSGSVSFNATPGSGYRVYVKGPKHLAKKICVASPTETAPGTYRCSDGQITLAAGTNTLDFSRIVLLAGDLPEQGGQGQNGVVDAYDVSFVRNNLGNKSQDVLIVGDLNLDGIIDTQDFSLILASLSVKYDEE